MKKTQLEKDLAARLFFTKFYDHVADFRYAGRPNEIFDFCNSLPRMKPEVGNCKDKPTHDTVQFGPRQAYLDCVPDEFRVVSSGPIPGFLMPELEEIERRYRQPFNSIQINRHYDQDSFVPPHHDAQQGHIAMMSLGAERPFILRHEKDDKAKTLNRYKAGDVLFDETLVHGSLLTLLPARQFEVTHEMPKSEVPCGVRVSLIFRYICEEMTRKLYGRDVQTANSKELRREIARFREQNGLETGPLAQPEGGMRQ